MTDDTNPYQSPRSILDPPLPDRPLVLAGKGRRLGTLVVDYIGILCAAFLLSLTLEVFLEAEWAATLQGVPDFVLGWSLLVGYYAFFEGIWARTPGKLVCGTVVVTESGARPSFGQVLGRTLCRLIPFEPFSFLGERGWHDSISKTKVVLSRVP